MQNRHYLIEKVFPMSDCCDSSGASSKPIVDRKYRRALILALVVVELAGGLRAESVSLLADTIDFLGDAGNYALSLFVLGLAPV